LGRLIYTEYVYAFELAAVILLVAMVAAIALTLRHRSGRKFLDPAQQVAVKRKDRIRIVSMPSEKKE
jgi:NADH-quinone oxidoreductase subunit J